MVPSRTPNDIFPKLGVPNAPTRAMSPYAKLVWLLLEYMLEKLQVLHLHVLTFLSVSAVMKLRRGCKFLLKRVQRSLVPANSKMIKKIGHKNQLHCKIEPAYFMDHAPTGWPKKVSHKVLSISLLNIDRLSKFFHLRILWKICNKVVTKHTTTP